MRLSHDNVLVICFLHFVICINTTLSSSCRERIAGILNPECANYNGPIVSNASCSVDLSGSNVHVTVAFDYVQFIGGWDQVDVICDFENNTQKLESRTNYWFLSQFNKREQPKMKQYVIDLVQYNKWQQSFIQCHIEGCGEKYWIDDSQCEDITVGFPLINITLKCNQTVTSTLKTVIPSTTDSILLPSNSHFTSSTSISDQPIVFSSPSDSTLFPSFVGFISTSVTEKDNTIVSTEESTTLTAELHVTSLSKVSSTITTTSLVSSASDVTSDVDSHSMSKSNFTMIIATATGSSTSSQPQQNEDQISTPIVIIIFLLLALGVPLLLFIIIFMVLGCHFFLKYRLKRMEQKQAKDNYTKAITNFEINISNEFKNDTFGSALTVFQQLEHELRSEQTSLATVVNSDHVQLTVLESIATSPTKTSGTVCDNEKVTGAQSTAMDTSLQTLNIEELSSTMTSKNSILHFQKSPSMDIQYFFSSSIPTYDLPKSYSDDYITVY